VGRRERPVFLYSVKKPLTASSTSSIVKYPHIVKKLKAKKKREDDIFTRHSRNIQNIPIGKLLISLVDKIVIRKSNKALVVKISINYIDK